jgi:hypothetical protein
MNGDNGLTNHGLYYGRFTKKTDRDKFWLVRPLGGLKLKMTQQGVCPLAP